MLFEIPIFFKVYGVKAGQTRATTYDVGENVEVDIPAVSSEAAPVAVEWSRTLPLGVRAGANVNPIDAIPRHPDEENAHVRIFNDRYYYGYCAFNVDFSSSDATRPPALRTRFAFEPRLPGNVPFEPRDAAGRYHDRP